MDYLATFESTRAVMQAEQILMRKKVPFETVPHSQYRQSGCGLAIVFAAEHRQAVVNALRGVGISIIYTVIILFFGFGIFVASDFGGTVAMGILTAVTLLVAMLTNFMLVPSILYGLERRLKNKSG